MLVNATGSVDFVLDSAYAPAGAILETCSGSLDVSFSYYQTPSANTSMSQALVKTSSKYGQVKAILNSTSDR